uniref:Chromate transporter n=1 Tax=Tetradesmus obliquus TaxID=3088 RepID=A0A383W4R4_TETOB|eukprot:jgi/Sobl393_1/18401/SZX71666.1
MAPIAPTNNESTIVVSHNDAEHAPGLHQRRHGALEVEQQHGSSSPDTSSPDVEAAISSNPSNDKDAAVPEAVEQQQVEEYAAVSYGDIAKQFSILGWTAFGGPAAHIGMFQRRLVEKLRWMSDEVYGELFALGQFMPGPTSTQVSFAIGIVKKGLKGGLLSGALFQYPGAFIMTAVGVFAANSLVDPTGPLAGVASGVAAVGVALVASAAKGMASKLCAGPLLSIICTLAAVIAYYWPKAYTFPALIAAGGLATLGWSYYKKQTPPPVKETDASVRSHGLNMVWGGITIAVWLIVLILTIVLASTLPNAPLPLKWWEVFYRTGSIIYGGGQVVLPMLYTDVVQKTCDAAGQNCSEANSWVTSEQFYAGLGVAQAMPGPLFNFSAYLGAIIAMRAGYSFAVGAVLAWFGLFGPGVLLIFGIMPFWGKFRTWSMYRRALPGLNAAGVGLIVASVFSLTFGALSVSEFKMTSLCIGIVAFTAVDQLKWFEPAVVVAGGVMGIIAWAGKMM